MPSLFERSADLTIIIPVYNLENYITPMLDSLKKQDTGDYEVEIIFVLNNCTDNSEKVIRQSGIDCQIIYCEKQGCGPSRNKALEIAEGKYIWFMDGDDWLLSDTAIKDAMNAAEIWDLDILRIPYESNSYNWLYFSMVWQYLIRKDFIGDVRFPNYQPGEDDAFTATLLAKANYIYPNMPSLNVPLYYYNYNREGSNMFRYNRGEKI